MAQTEKRFIESQIEVRRAADQGLPMLIGYAAKFDSLSEEIFGFREKIAPGAFRQSLIRGDDVRALVDHDPSRIIGRSKAGTLRMVEDDTGLRVEIDPPDTQSGRDIVTSIERGDVSQMSFGFITREDEWTEDRELGTVRTLIDVDLFDVSPVTFPAYPDTEIDARDMGDAIRRFAEFQNEMKRSDVMDEQIAEMIAEDTGHRSIQDVSRRVRLARVKFRT